MGLALLHTIAVCSSSMHVKPRRRAPKKMPGPSAGAGSQERSSGGFHPLYFPFQFFCPAKLHVFKVHPSPWTPNDSLQGKFGLFASSGVCFLWSCERADFQAGKLKPSGNFKWEIFRQENSTHLSGSWEVFVPRFKRCAHPARVSAGFICSPCSASSFAWQIK